jgi:hypothetical protein
MEWTDKLAELIFDNLPGAARLLPDHVQRRVKARLRDLNPLATISANEDLARTLRLAWIEAALDVDTRARVLVQQAEWRAAVDTTERFSALLRAELVGLRQAAFRRDEALSPSPIDAALKSLLTDLPRYVVNRSEQRGGTLDAEFLPTLAATLSWPVEQVPAVFAHVASEGVANDGAQRRFGELVFAAFAEIVKHPGDNPEASVAFNLAQQAMAREVALQTLAAARGLDQRFDRLLARLEGAPYRSLAEFACIVEDAAGRLARIEHKVDALPTRDEVLKMLARVAGLAERPDLVPGVAALTGQARGYAADLLPADPFRRVLRLYDEDSVPDASLALTLERYAWAYRALQNRLAGQAEAARYAGPTRQELEALLQSGNLDAADELMAAELARHDEQMRAAARERAAILADRAHIAFLRDDMVAMCLFLGEARQQLRFAPACAWGHALRLYVYLCRDWHVQAELMVPSPLDDEPTPVEPAADDGAVTQAQWRERAVLAQSIDACAALVVAGDEDYTRFRSWSLRIERIALGLLSLAERTREAADARAAVAGLELFGTSFHSADDPIDIDLNTQQQRDAKALYAALRSQPYQSNLRR